MEKIQTTIKIPNSYTQIFTEMACGMYKGDITILNETKLATETEFLVDVPANKLFDIGRIFQRMEIYEHQMLQPIRKKVSVEIPVQFKKLCLLIECRPESIIQGFIHDLAKSVNGSSGGDERMFASQYFMRTFPVGSAEFQYEEVETMLYELDELRRSWYNFGNQKEQEFQKYYTQQLNKWFNDWNKIKKQRKEKQHETKDRF